MRKSREVPLTLLAAVAVSVTGCDHFTYRNCVDRQNRIVPSESCVASPGGTAYRYLYRGASGGNIGDTVIGGEEEAGVRAGAAGSSAESAAEEEGVIRGGFGATGKSGGE